MALFIWVALFFILRFGWKVHPSCLHCPTVLVKPYKFCFVFLKPFPCFSNELQQEQSSGLCSSSVWLGRMQLSGQWFNCWPVYMPIKETLRRSGLSAQVKTFSSFIVSQLGLCIDWVSQVGSIFCWMHHAEHMDAPSSINIWQRVRLFPFPSFSWILPLFSVIFKYYKYLFDCGFIQFYSAFLRTPLRMKYFRCPTCYDRQCFNWIKKLSFRLARISVII